MIERTYIIALVASYVSERDGFHTMWVPIYSSAVVRSIAIIHVHKVPTPDAE